jgi:hypothetical protein
VGRGPWAGDWQVGPAHALGGESTEQAGQSSEGWMMDGTRESEPWRGADACEDTRTLVSPLRAHTASHARVRAATHGLGRRAEPRNVLLRHAGPHLRRRWARHFYSPRRWCGPCLLPIRLAGDDEWRFGTVWVAPDGRKCPPPRAPPTHCTRVVGPGLVCPA